MNGRSAFTVIAVVIALLLSTMTQALAQDPSGEQSEQAVRDNPRATEGLRAADHPEMLAPRLNMTPARAEDGFVVQPGVVVHHLGTDSGRRDSDVGAIYPDVNASTNLVSQTLEASTRHMLTLHDADAPQQHRFRVSAETPVELRMSDEGGVHVIARNLAFEEELPDEVDPDGFGALEPHEVELAYIKPPWAEDAEGNAVPTEFEIRGQTVVQTIDHHSADVAYPIVADPQYTCGWTTCTIWYNRAETKFLADYGWIGGGVCGAVPWPASWVCMTYVGLHWQTAVNHHNAGGCLYQRFTYANPAIQWAGGHYGQYCY